MVHILQKNKNNILKPQVFKLEIGGSRFWIKICQTAELKFALIKFKYLLISSKETLDILNLGNVKKNKIVCS